MNFDSLFIFQAGWGNFSVVMSEKFALRRNFDAVLVELEAISSSYVENLRFKLSYACRCVDMYWQAYIMANESCKNDQCFALHLVFLWKAEFWLDLAHF